MIIIISRKELFHHLQLRAKETIELVVAQITKFNHEDLIFQDDLYLAEFTQLIEIINTYQNDAQSLMLVGHNPGIENLVNYLCESIRRSRKQRLQQQIYLYLSMLIIVLIQQQIVVR